MKRKISYTKHLAPTHSASSATVLMCIGEVQNVYAICDDAVLCSGTCQSSRQMLQHYVFDPEVTPVSSSGRLPRTVPPNARRRFEAFILLSPFCATDIRGDTIFDSQWRLTILLYGGSGTEIHHLLQFVQRREILATRHPQHLTAQGLLPGHG